MSRFDILLAKHVLGILTVKELPKIALGAIQAGYDSPSLRQLTGICERDTDEAHRLFAKTILELKLSVPTEVEAGLIIARNIAEEVLDGVVTPYEGAKRIWWQVYARLPELKQLKIFVGLASEYEDDPKHQEDYSRQIVDECKILTAQKMNSESQLEKE